jgi:hypothetical protein
MSMYDYTVTVLSRLSKQSGVARKKPRASGNIVIPFILCFSEGVCWEKKYRVQLSMGCCNVQKYSHREKQRYALACVCAIFMTIVYQRAVRVEMQVGRARIVRSSLARLHQYSQDLRKAFCVVCRGGMIVLLFFCNFSFSEP